MSHMAINLDAKKIQTKSQWQKSETTGRLEYIREMHGTVILRFGARRDPINRLQLSRPWTLQVGIVSTAGGGEPISLWVFAVLGARHSCHGAPPGVASLGDDEQARPELDEVRPARLVEHRGERAQQQPRLARPCRGEGGLRGEAG